LNGSGNGKLLLNGGRDDLPRLATALDAEARGRDLTQFCPADSLSARLCRNKFITTAGVYETNFGTV